MAQVFFKPITNDSNAIKKQMRVTFDIQVKSTIFYTVDKRGARAQFPLKLSLKFSTIFALKPKVKIVAEKLTFILLT